MKYYHNPRCSKSRQGLDILKNKGENPEVILYLNEPLKFEDLKITIDKLGISPENLIRKNESIYKENFKGRFLSDEQWIQAMIDHPKLIERPIFIVKNKGVIGRPPEKVLDLL
jgi:arsenate reductase